MRIALVSREYPPETGVGGIGTYVYHVARALAGLGHEVHVVSRNPEPYERSYSDGPVTVHRVREKKLTGKWAWRLYRLFPITEYHYAKRVFDKVWELHREKPFDVIELPDYRAEGFFIVQRPPARTVTKLHTPTRIANEINSVAPSVHETLVDWMERYAANKSDWITSSSSSLADWTARVWKMDRSRFEVVANPIDNQRWIAHPMPEGPPIVLFVGRLEVRKGVRVIGQAWPEILAQVPGARLRMIGNVDKAPLRQEVEANCATKGCAETLEWLPWQDNDTLRRFYQEAHLVLIPSVFDNFPAVCLEAMASGRPVVASASGGLVDMVEDGVTGTLIPPLDREALVKATVALLQDRRRCELMGDAGARRVAEKFSPSIVGQATTNVYERVIQNA